MASIRRPRSPAKQQHLLRHHHHHPFASSSSSPSSPLRHSSSSSSSSPRKRSPFLFSSSSSHRRPFPRFAAFFLLGSFLGLIHFLSHIPHFAHHHNIHPSTTTSPAAAASFLSTTSAPPRLHQYRSHEQTEEQEEEEDHKEKELLIVVTPTRARAAQSLYLTRMGHTLRRVRPPLLWLVVDAGDPAPDAAAALRRTSVAHRYVGTGRSIDLHLNASSDEYYRIRAARQMNAALEIVENHRLHGIVHFAREEDVYSIHLFRQMRRIRRFGTWPFPVVSQNNDAKGGVVLEIEGPVCNKDGQVVGWHTRRSEELRRFHVAMSGFAFNSTMLWDPRLRSRLAWNPIRHPETVKEGFQGTTFVEQLVEDESQMEGVPADCSQVMNWHVPFG